jgi:hypothetical protein
MLFEKCRQPPKKRHNELVFKKTQSCRAKRIWAEKKPEPQIRDSGFFILIFCQHEKKYHTITSGT